MNKSAKIGEWIRIITDQTRYIPTPRNCIFCHRFVPEIVLEVLPVTESGLEHHVCPTHNEYIRHK